MYGTGTTRRQEGAKADAAKRKRDAGPDILNPQIRALEAMDEALDTDHTTEHNTKGQEAWRMNLGPYNFLELVQKPLKARGEPWGTQSLVSLMGMLKGDEKNNVSRHPLFSCRVSSVCSAFIVYDMVVCTCIALVFRDACGSIWST